MISFVKSLVLLIWSSLETVGAFLMFNVFLRKVHGRVTKMVYTKHNNTRSLTTLLVEGTFFAGFLSARISVFSF